jgi:PAS domain S-box-containing protein
VTIRVLLVDKDPAIEELATGLLMGEGDISAVAVPSAKAALDKLNSADYDAMVCEYDLPDMNGIDLLRVAREEGFSKTCIIFSARGDESVALDAILSGADHYLPKTGKISQDISIIRSILQKVVAKVNETRDRRSGYAYHSLLMRISEGFAYHRIIHNEDGYPVSSMIIDSNHSFEKIIGLSGEVAIGRDVRSVFKGEDEFDQKLLAAFNEIIFTAEEKRFEAFSKRLNKKFLIALIPSEPGHFATLISEIKPAAVNTGTDDRTTGQDIVELTKNFELVFDNIPAMISIRDLDGNFIRINRAFSERMKVRPNDLSNLPLKLISPELYDSVRKEDPEIIRTGTPMLGLEKRIMTLEGDIFWGRVDKLPFRDEDGQILGVISYVTDISSRKEIEHELELARKKLHLLGSITRHDILNKLSALSGFLALAQMKQDPKAIQESIVKASKAGEQIKKILEFSRAYEKVGAQAPEWFSAQDMARLGTIESTPNDIAMNINLEGVEIFADRMMEKVFHNLVDNAARHGKATKVDLFYEKEGDELRIICQDDGLGVSKESRELMFDDRFGHGLYLVKEILKLTGMRIKETSPGKGARFEITVPPGSYRLRTTV